MELVGDPGQLPHLPHGKSGPDLLSLSPILADVYNKNAEAMTSRSNRIFLFDIVWADFVS